MKFAVGYQARTGGELFSEMAADYREQIAEVYFAYPGFASGRPGAGADRMEKTEQLEYELAEIRKLGIGLDLLLNGNCYGEWAVSERFEREIAALLERLESLGLRPQTVTAASPFAAATVRKYAPDIELRASVNMRIDSLSAMEYLSDKFDSFHIRRDLQRDLPTVKKFYDWCAAHGKRLCMLINSGCLNRCPYQTFHDNLVAHDERVRELRNAADFMPHLCWERYRDRRNWADFLRGSWIRPEDLHQYEPYFAVVKLATRQHSHPRMVLGAYAAGHFDGNLADLTEPCFSEAFAPEILDNRRLDGVELPGACAADCTHCGRCEAILERALIRVGGDVQDRAAR